MKVIGAGMGRTGTLSLKTALERLLGEPCYHMETIIRRPDQLDAWYAWSRDPQAEPDWDAILPGFAAGVDAPLCLFWETLHRRYPEAKVVLTLRDPEKWCDSFTTLMRTNIRGAWMGLFSSRARRMGAFGRTLGKHFMGSLDRQHLIDTFNAHNQRVRDTVPADRLLEFRVQEGWGPLCAFLDQPIPDAPFPRLNEGMELIRKGQWELAFGRKGR